MHLSPLPSAVDIPKAAAEAERLKQLHELLVLHSEPEPLFDLLAQQAAQACGVPIALLSLVDEQQQWFKANVGLPGVAGTPRAQSFCAHALGEDALMEVPDACADPRFVDNPLVTGEPRIRFYAGAPLVLAPGVRVGTLCVIHQQPLVLSEAQRQTLSSLAALASQALCMRRDLLKQALAARSRYELALADSESRYRAIVEAQSELVSLAQADGELVYVNPAYAGHFGLLPAQMVGCNLYDFIDPVDREVVRAQLTEVLRSGHSRSGENRMVAADGQMHWVAWTNGLQHSGEAPPLLHSVGRDITQRRLTEQALRASQDFLYRTGRVAGVGGWEMDLASGHILWSDETRRIHGVAPDFQPQLDTAIAFYAPEGRAQVEAAVQRGIEHGEAWDLELPFINHQGQALWVRAVGEVEFSQGQPVRLVGAFQDISERKRLQQGLADSERFVRQITDNLPLRIAYVSRDRRYRFVNLGHCRRFGRERSEILGRTRVELTGGIRQAELEAALDAALAGQDQHVEFDEMLNGQVRRIDCRMIPDLSAQGEVQGVFAATIDVTERAEAKAQALRQTATLRSVVEAIPAMVAVVGSDLCYRLVNSSFERWCGRPREQLVGQTVLSVLGPLEYSRSQPWMARVLAGEHVQFEKDEIVSGAHTRHLAISFIPLWLDNGVVDGYVGVAQDITQHRQEEVRLLQLTQRDTLTGLLNRAGFEAFLHTRLQAGLPEAAALSLLYIDLDHFKPVNDQHGHPVGDQLLQQFAQRLRGLVRPSDAVARLGGDEFAVVLCGVLDGAVARVVATKVIDAAHAPFQLGPLTLHIGASVGVACGVEADSGWPGLVARADAALYQAKRAGRGRVASH